MTDRVENLYLLTVWLLDIPSGLDAIGYYLILPFT